MSNKDNGALAKMKSSVRSAFEGDEGSIFWAVGRIVAGIKIGAEAISSQLNMMQRAMQPKDEEEDNLPESKNVKG